MADGSFFFDPRRGLDMIEARRADLARRAAEQQLEDARRNSEEIKQDAKSLLGFVRRAWHVLEPTTPYVEGWAIQEIARHLEAVTFGEINRLLINVPPGMMKSLLTCVFWPAWEWGPQARPSLRYFTSSYNEDLAVRDTRKMKQLIESEWYQELWGDRVRQGDKWGEKYLENESRGSRRAVAFASLTGGRGDRVIIDDPLSSEQAESDADRDTANRIVRESLPSRVNNDDSAIVVIMQRLHEKDPSGTILKLGMGFTHLMLPMEYEPDRQCVTHRRDGTEFFRDPRTYKGELLFPEFFTKKRVDGLKVPLGAYGVAGQLQQRPAPRDGGLFALNKLRRVAAVPMTASKRVRSWDLAGTEKRAGNDPDWTAGVRMAKDPDGIIYIENCERFQEESDEVYRTMKAIASQDGKDCWVTFPQDPAQAGKAQAKSLGRLFAGWPVKAIPTSGAKSKILRATPLATQIALGNVVLVETGNPMKDTWIEDFLAELGTFPAGAHDDQVDAAADAFNEIADVLDGEGLIEHYRQEAAAAARADAGEVLDDEKVRIEGRPEMRSFVGMTGERHERQEDGTFLVSDADATAMLALGFRKVTS
jgi:predicted phage terminase large subunit-like protein